MLHTLLNLPTHNDLEGHPKIGASWEGFVVNEIMTRLGARPLACRLLSQSPWLNPIEPKWVQGKRAIVEPDRLLSAEEIVDRVYAYYGCAEEAHLAIPEKAA